MGRVAQETFAEFDELEQSCDDIALSATNVLRHVDECGHLDDLRKYSELGVDREPHLLTAFIRELELGADLGDGYRSNRVPLARCHNIPGRLMSLKRASLQYITREARAVALNGRCSEFDFPISLVASLYRILRELGWLQTFKMFIRYVKFYAVWRQRWGKHALSIILFDGIPEGEAWNPVTWTLASEFRKARSIVLSLDRFSYLQSMFTDRQHPERTRFFYALTADEDARLECVCNSLYQLGGTACIRGLLYDGLVFDVYGEGDDVISRASPADLGEEEEIPGMVEKAMTFWSDNFFMRLRRISAATTESCVKHALGKRMCILSAIMNIGSRRTQTCAGNYKERGPHSYANIQRWLVASRTGEYLKPSWIDHVVAASVGSRFIIHWNEHAVGIERRHGDCFVVADCRYCNTRLVALSNLHELFNVFDDQCASTKPVCWELASGSYRPTEYTAQHFLSAGC